VGSRVDGDPPIARASDNDHWSRFSIVSLDMKEDHPRHGRDVMQDRGSNYRGRGQGMEGHITTEIRFDPRYTVDVETDGRPHIIAIFGLWLLILLRL
jgi:hypothetical protein